MSRWLYHNWGIGHCFEEVTEVQEAEAIAPPQAIVPPQVTAPSPTYTPPSTCTDSDGGLEIFMPGTISYYGTETSNDGCAGNDLVERYCKGNDPARQIFLCPSDCITTGGIGYCGVVE